MFSSEGPRENVTRAPLWLSTGLWEIGKNRKYTA